MTEEQEKVDELRFEDTHEGEPCHTKAEIFDDGNVWLWQGTDEEEPGQDMIGITKEELNQIFEASEEHAGSETDVLKDFRFVWIINRTGYGLYMREPNGRERPVFNTQGRSSFFFMDQITSCDGEVVEVSKKFWPTLYLASPMCSIKDDEKREELHKDLFHDLEKREKELINIMYDGIFVSKKATRMFDTQVAILLRYAKRFTREHEDFNYEQYEQQETLEDIE